jgi:hypothetical protein
MSAVNAIPMIGAYAIRTCARSWFMTNGGINELADHNVHFSFTVDKKSHPKGWLRFGGLARFLDAPPLPQIILYERPC